MTRWRSVIGRSYKASGLRMPNRRSLSALALCNCSIDLLVSAITAMRPCPPTTGFYGWDNTLLLDARAHPKIANFSIPQSRLVLCAAYCRLKDCARQGQGLLTGIDFTLKLRGLNGI